MGIFTRGNKIVYDKAELVETIKVAPRVDFEADKYSAVAKIKIIHPDGTEQNLEVDMGLKQLHQLTTNLYLTCRAFNLPIGDSTADRARGFWGMR